jgi:hypothetical protein
MDLPRQVSSEAPLVNRPLHKTLKPRRVNRIAFESPIVVSAASHVDDFVEGSLVAENHCAFGSAFQILSPTATIVWISIWKSHNLRTD